MLSSTSSGLDAELRAVSLVAACVASRLYPDVDSPVAVEGKTQERQEAVQAAQESKSPSAPGCDSLEQLPRAEADRLHQAHMQTRMGTDPGRPRPLCRWI